MHAHVVTADAGPAGPARKPNFLSTQVTDARRYYLNLAPRPGAALEVVCGGVERCRGDYVIERSGFRYLAIEFVAEGLGQLHLAGHDYRLRPGMAFAYGPGVRHVIRNDPQRPMLKYYVDFVGRSARRLLRESPLSEGRAVQVSAPQEILGVLEDLQRSGVAQSPFSPAICAQLVGLLILKLSGQSLAPGAAEARAFPTYERVRQHLEQHFAEFTTVEDVARACHLDVSYLCRLFQRFHHASPYQVLLRLRLNKAAGLLLDQGLRVKEVAGRLGFTDPCNFSRAFKRIYGVSPERFVKVGRRL
jgi:AraC-like DNA-binding protein